MTREQVLAWCAVIVAVGAAGGVLVKAVRWLMSLLGEVREFLQDWRGEPGRAGVDERPGVMERLAGIERQIGRADARLDRVERQLLPNGGQSMRDQLGRVERAVTDDQGD